MSTKLGLLRSTISVDICFGDEEAGASSNRYLGADAVLYAVRLASRNFITISSTIGSDVYREPELPFA